MGYRFAGKVEFSTIERRFPLKKTTFSYGEHDVFYSNACSYRFFQKTGLRSNNTVKSSKRPMSI